MYSCVPYYPITEAEQGEPFLRLHGWLAVGDVSEAGISVMEIGHH